MILSKGLKNEFETAVVNQTSVFEPLKFYCILVCVFISLVTSLNSICLHVSLFIVLQSTDVVAPNRTENDKIYALVTDLFSSEFKAGPFSYFLNLSYF